MVTLHRECFRVPYEPHGISLNAWSFGRGQDACILLHGFADGAYVWDSFAPSIAASLRVIAIELRGHGDSSWDPLSRYNVEQYTADVLHVIDTLGLKKYAVVGHSLGGAIAIRLAALRRDQVQSLMIVDYGPDLIRQGAVRVHEDFRDSLRPWRSIAEYEQWLRERRPIPDRSQLAHIARCALRPQTGGHFRVKADPALGSSDDKATGQSAEVWAMLPLIYAPVTVVRGSASAVLSAEVVNRMIRVLPDGRAVTINGAGHAVMSDNPQEFARALDAFLSDESARTIGCIQATS